MDYEYAHDGSDVSHKAAAADPNLGDIDFLESAKSLGEAGVGGGGPTTIFGSTCLDILFKFCCSSELKRYHPAARIATTDSTSQSSFIEDRFDHAADWLINI